MTTSNDQNFTLLCQIRETQIQQAEKFGTMAGQLESLAGPTGRIAALETTDNRQYWLHAAVLPLLLALHGIARKAGLTI